MTSPRVRADTPTTPPPTCTRIELEGGKPLRRLSVDLIVDRDIDRDAAVLGADAPPLSLIDPAKHAADDQGAHAGLERTRLGAQHVVAEAGQVLRHPVGQVERDGPSETRRPLLARHAPLAAIQRKPEARIQGYDLGRERELADQDRVRVRCRRFILRAAACKENKKKNTRPAAAHAAATFERIDICKALNQRPAP